MTTELWRLQSDAVVRAAVARFIPGPGSAALKTDLYDESVSSGVLGDLSNRYRSVHGIDTDAAVVESARRRHPEVELQVADVRGLPFDAKLFDAVLSNSTLDHFAGPAPVASALREIHRVLVPGGKLLLTMDNPRNPLVAIRNLLPVGAAARIRGGFGYPAGWTPGPRGLRRLLVDAGFEVQVTTALLHGPRFIAARLGPARGEDPLTDPRLARLLWLERLERWPTRAATGHFLAALARVPDAS